MPKFATLQEFYNSLPKDQETAIRRFADYVETTYPDLELVLAWNQPMFKLGKKYLIGFMPAKNHINLLTMTNTPVTHFSERLSAYRHGTRSISVPFDWNIDEELIKDILLFRAEEESLTL